MFGGQTSTVSIIGALNESVSCLIEVNVTGQIFSQKKGPLDIEAPSC